MIAVVSGLPRSGTSLAMQMLEAGGIPPLVDAPGDPSRRAADASNPRGYYELDAVRRLREGAPWVSEAEGHAVKVVAPLLSHLPPGPSYRVVFMLRDLDEVIASQTAMLDRLGRPTAPATVLHGAFSKHVEAARKLLDSEDRFHTLYLEHASVIGEPERAAAAIAAFFSEDGIFLDVRAMLEVIDPSLHRSKSAR